MQLLTLNQLIFVTLSEPIPQGDETEFQGWAYIGSANLSESAW